MSLEVTGKIEKYLDVQEGTTKGGEQWKKQSFLVRTDEKYNNLYSFELFAKGDGLDKIDNLLKYNKEGDVVKVSFNVSTNEYNGKYYTSLSAWRVDNGKQSEGTASNTVAEVVDDLPF